MRDRRTSFWRFGAVALGALLALSFAVGVSAHESREVGEFEFVVGFANEPAVANELNGIDLRISDADGEPVVGAEAAINAEIIYGEESVEVELRPVFGSDGEYTADLIPTETGAYSFHFTGELDGQEIDETFTAGPDTFSEVEPRNELEFPASGGNATSDDSGQATAFGMAGIAAGLLGLIAGGAAYYKVSNNEPRQPGPAERRRQQKQREDE